MAGKSSKKSSEKSAPVEQRASTERPIPKTTRSPASGTKSAAGKRTKAAAHPTASELIDQRIRDLGGWRGETLARMRALILEADPEMTEETKWMGTPVWSHHGIVCTGEAYKSVVKLTFAKGAAVPDPARLFNSSLEGNTRRAIDIHAGESVDARAFKALVKAAVAQNAQRLPKKAGAKAKTGARKAKPAGAKADEPGAVVLLSGGNPQIAKADGDAPVQAYIAAMPGWKRALGERLDALVVRSVPNVRKAVKWNSPFYGIEGRGWFMSFHVFTHFVKVTFFEGMSLRPIPPGGTERSKDARWIDIREDDELDEAQMTKWFKQAAALPGWVP
jgi:hypothetical protein